MKKRALIILIVTATAAALGCDNRSGDPAESASANAPAKAEAESTSSNNEDRYSVESPKSAVTVGKTQTVNFEVKPASGLKINHDYPWKISFEDAGGVEIASKTVGGAKIELSDEAATIPVQLRANAAGDHKIAATGSFSVCNDTKCYVMRDQAVELDLAAKAESKAGKEGAKEAADESAE
ncbi:MAG: hypothetical protein ACQEVA_20590 [Myxococcota bacterium]